ncbi:MAG: helix-turn-helix domain-containing protein [Limisphaerales bacterium]
MRYPWPGNVRELRAAVEHAVVFARGRKVDLSDLPSPLRASPSVVRPEDGGHSLFSAHAQASSSKEAGGSLSGFSLQENEKQLMIEALKATRGNRTEAARLMGMSRRTLHRKMSKYNLY